MNALGVLKIKIIRKINGPYKKMETGEYEQIKRYAIYYKGKGLQN